MPESMRPTDEPSPQDAVTRRRISLVLPTYNPAERSFARVLASVERVWRESRADVECVVVDNNSSPPLSDRPYIREFVERTGARIVVESKQGLAFARIAGFTATSGRAVIVIDDDNVLPESPNYLDVVTRLLDELPFVGVWGPGNVTVEFLDAVPAWMQQRARGQHGEKRYSEAQYACAPGWYAFYPVGMGQVIRREVADVYTAGVASGELSATGRQGLSLAGAEDNQLVWCAVGMGLAAGVHPDLRLQHLIPGSRCTMRYFRRLMFGCGISHYRARAQSFPEQAVLARKHVPSIGRYGLQVVKVVAQSASQNRFRFLTIDLAEMLGEWCGHASVAGRDNHWVFSLARTLRLT